MGANITHDDWKSGGQLVTSGIYRLIKVISVFPNVMIIDCCSLEVSLAGGLGGAITLN